MKHYSGLNTAFQWNQKSPSSDGLLICRSGRKPDGGGTSSYLGTGVDILNIRLDLFDAVRRVGMSAEEFGRPIA